MEDEKKERRLKRQLILILSLLLASLMIYLAYRNLDSSAKTGFWWKPESYKKEDSILLKIQNRFFDSILKLEQKKDSLSKAKPKPKPKTKPKKVAKKPKPKKKKLSKPKKQEDFSLKEYSEELEPLSFMSVDQNPVFYGCQSIKREKARFRCTLKKMQKYILINFRYPQQGIQKRIQGEVVVSFEVSAAGKIENIEVLRKVHPLLDNEAKRLIEKLPNMIPGKHQDRPVPVKFSMPVNFKLTY